MSRIRLKVGKIYYNPFKEENFTVLKVDRGRDKVFIRKESGEDMWRTLSLMEPLVRKTIEAEMDGFQQNISKDNWSVFVNTLNGDEKATEKILEKIKDEYVDTDIPVEWQGSKYEWFFRIVGNSTKGMVARKMYLGLMESFGREVDKSDGDYIFRAKEFSGIVDGKKKLIKVACVKKFEKITFNNIRQFQEWDDIVLVCMFPHHVEIYETSKEELLEHLKTNEGEVIWAGGQEKKDRLGGDITKNDYFHWLVDYKVLSENLENI
jgi:hypothetical protein